MSPAFAKPLPYPAEEAEKRMPRWQWLVSQLTRRLWVRATFIGGLGILAALLAAFIEPYIPWELPGQIGVESVESLLTIIASSMLTVTTFSLTTMISAYSSATSNITPRATRLLIEDRLTQTVLSTFIGSFLFGIVGLIVLKTGAYGDRGRVVLFIVTIGVIALVVVSLLRWIDDLTRLGRVGETTDRVENAAQRALEQWIDEPCMGGTPLMTPDTDIPAGAVSIITETIGYVQNVDIPALAQFSEAKGADLFVAALPGSFVYADSPLVWISGFQGDFDTEARAEIRSAFAIHHERSFDQDPRFGLAVMSEIACRALSPAVNDPGTAIDVIGRSTRLMSLWAQASDAVAGTKPRHPRLHVPLLRTEDLFEDSFAAVARDGAGLIEVQLRMQKSLLALARMGDETFRSAALHQSHMALQRAERAMALEADVQRLRDVVRTESVTSAMGPH